MGCKFTIIITKKQDLQPKKMPSNRFYKNRHINIAVLIDIPIDWSVMIATYCVGENGFNPS